MRMRPFTPPFTDSWTPSATATTTHPLIIISPIWCPIHENIPGPGAFDDDALAAGHLRVRTTGDPSETSAGKLTLATIRTELARIIEQ